jgi:alpha-mannosidase
MTGVTSSSGMVYEDAEKLYAEVLTDTEKLVDRALAVLYPSSLPLLSAVPASTSGPLMVFAHNTTAFARRDVVRVPLGERGISSGNVLLQKTNDGKEGYVVLEGGAGGGLVLPSQISTKDLNGTQTPMAIMLLWLTFMDYSVDVSVHSASSDSFVLGNKAIQLTVAGGRITSLFDVRLKCVSFLFSSLRLGSG